MEKWSKAHGRCIRSSMTDDVNSLWLAFFICQCTIVHALHFYSQKLEFINEYFKNNVSVFLVVKLYCD